MNFTQNHLSSTRHQGLYETKVFDGTAIKQINNDMWSFSHPPEHKVIYRKMTRAQLPKWALIDSETEQDLSQVNAHYEFWREGYNQYFGEPLTDYNEAQSSSNNVTDRGEPKRIWGKANMYIELFGDNTATVRPSGSEASTRVTLRKDLPEYITHPKGPDDHVLASAFWDTPGVTEEYLGIHEDGTDVGDLA